MKAWRRVALDLLLMVLLLPQVFVLCYFFPFFFAGGNPLGLLKSVATYALTISWVSAPFLVLLTLLVKSLIGSRVRWFVILPLCVGAGFLWVAAWNLLVYEAFSYLRAALPVLLCSVGAAGWAIARAVYLASLPASEKTDSPAPDLSE